MLHPVEAKFFVKILQSYSVFYNKFKISSSSVLIPVAHVTLSTAFWPNFEWSYFVLKTNFVNASNIFFYTLEACVSNETLITVLISLTGKYVLAWVKLKT